MLVKTHSALDVLGPFVDNVTLGISLNETARGSTKGTTHYVLIRKLL